MIIDKQKDEQKYPLTTVFFVTLIFLTSYSCSRLPADVREISENTLISRENPEAQFKVDQALHFLADTSFILKENSNAEIYYFTDEDQGAISRYLLIQFESMLPEIEGTYNYDAADSVSIGDLNFIWNYWCFNPEQVVQYVPDSDIAVGQKLLNSRNASTPGNFAGIRFVYLSEDRRSEALIIYGENIELRVIDCDMDFRADPKMEAMYRDALKAIHITSLQ